MTKRKILVLDDSVDYTRLVKLTLETVEEFEVKIESDPLKALEAAREFLPDVILLELTGARDRVNPVGEMHVALAEHPAGIIVLTSYADDDEREAALKAGAHRFLLKQIDSARLLNEIESVASEVAASNPSV